MIKLMKFPERFAPPGADLSQLYAYLIGTPFFAFCYSLLGYFNNYSRSYYEIIDRFTGQRITMDRMPVFGELLCLEAFPVFCAGWLAFVISNYLYFFQESKSIYTMRRLRSPWELHLRCWTLPALGALLLLLCSALLTGLYALHYFTFTPPELLPAQFLTLWR